MLANLFFGLFVQLELRRVNHRILHAFMDHGKRVVVYVTYVYSFRIIAPDPDFLVEIGHADNTYLLSLNLSLMNLDSYCITEQPQTA